jgi:hypothetical protein
MIMSRIMVAVLASVLCLDGCLDVGVVSVPIGRIGGSDKKCFLSCDLVLCDVASMI